MPDLSIFSTNAPWHILTYGTLLGSEIFQSFIAGPVAYKALARPAFATLQTAIFPVYFSMQTALPALLALTYPGSSSAIIPSSFSGVLHESNRGGVLVPIGTMFVTGLANLVFLGPWTTKVMRERKHQETRDGKKAYDPAPHSQEMMRLNKKFGVLHGLSSITNLIGLFAMVWYGGHLAERMRDVRIFSEF